MRILLGLLLISGTAFAGHTPTGDVHESVQGALLCKGNPLDTLRAHTKAGSATWDAGYVSASRGEETSYVDVLVLKKPLTISGASTFAIIGELENSNSDFGGLVYARFRGDYKKVVKTLGLKKQKSDVGTYTRSLKTGLDDQPETLCPKTIGLTPKEGGEFLLGCGWCNG